MIATESKARRAHLPRPVTDPIALISLSAIRDPAAAHSCAPLGSMPTYPPGSVSAFDLILIGIPTLIMRPSATSVGIAGNSCWLDIHVARHYMLNFFNDVGLRPHPSEIVASDSLS